MAEAFGATSTTDEVLEGVSLSGKRVLVTGVSAGLGVETARALAAHGAEVTAAARDLIKAKAATARARAGTANGGGLKLVELDLASLTSVRACADALLADGQTFDLVIANAGVMACPFGKTADGFETQFGTNHLGHFVLVNRITSLMKPGSRLVNLSFAGHRRSDVDLDDPNFERTSYAELIAYGRSKTANILFAVEFDRRHKSNGIRGTAVHPGAIETELGRHMTAELRQQVIGHQRGQRIQRRRGVPLEDDPPRRGDVGLGRGGGETRGGRRPLLRELPRGGAGRGARFLDRRAALCARSGARQSALVEERGNGRRALLSGGAGAPSPALTAPSSLSSLAAPCRSRYSPPSCAP
jgi:NAD(P)-dependent dehydrogenase (short-subunit alcohol dehydrogenase family)